jgi:glc operon protein GlcG
MTVRFLSAAMFGAVLLTAGSAVAQQPPAPAAPAPAAPAAPAPAAPAMPDLNAIPEKMPFSTPYGAPIGLEKADAAIAAALAEATKRGWAMNVAVVDSGGNLVSFKRQDGAQLASISIAEHKARVAVKYRRPTRAFEDAVQHGILYIATLDDVVASRGGIPLVEDGKIIGAIGCSGGTGSQDEATCTVGAATINKSM